MRAFKGDPKKDDVVKRMLASGNWKLGPNGELLRVSAKEANQAALQRSREAANPAKYSPTTVGFMTPERKEYLENLNRPLTPMEAREYATVSFDPSEGPNVLFGLAAGSTPVEPVGALVGQGLKRAGNTFQALRKGTPFKSEIDWGKWNPDTPKNKELMEEYHEIEKRTKEDGTWMKNPDGTKFDGPPELFVQMQSKAFKKAFPRGYDKIYRGASSYDGQGLTPTSKSRNLKSDAHFFSEDRSQAEQYVKFGEKDRETVGADYADRHSGVYEMAYPPDTRRLDLDTRGSGFANIELFSEKTIPEFESQISELKEIIRTSKNSSEKSNAAFNLDWIEELLKYIKDNPNPRRVSSDAEVADFLEKYRLWAQSSDDAGFPEGMLTDDIAIFMEENPELYDRIVLRGLDDESIGDVNMINLSRAPYPKSLKGNVGTFDLSDPNVFKALVPIIGMSAAIKLAKSQGVENPGEKMSNGGIIPKKKKPTGMSAIRK